MPSLTLRWGWIPFAVVGVIACAGLVYWVFSSVISSGGSNHQIRNRLAGTPLKTAVSNDPVLVGAGDISSCAQDNDASTAKLLDEVVTGATGELVVFTAGDNAYESGTSAEFEQCYDPTWGRYKDRTRPASGNHEYKSGNAEGYFNYFGAAAGDPTRGYYSYDLGTWHIVVLNTNDHCQQVACDKGSAQEEWLLSDLAAHPAPCTLAIWHDPRFTSGTKHGNSPWVMPFWDDLYRQRADVVVSAHEHNYERFAPQTPTGESDPQFGIREFVVGTGGESHYSNSESVLANSEIGDDSTYGVIKLILHPEGYDWEFIPQGHADAFQDWGSGVCHGPPKSP